MVFNKLKFPLLAIIITIAVLLVASVSLNNPFKKPGINVDLTQASVVKEIQSLNRLETSSFTIEKIVEAGQGGNAFQELLYGDRILLIAHGKVIAGVDMSGITEKDISIRGNDLTINLPSPVIFSSTLDNSKTRVYDRTQGFLSRGNKNLESVARREAEESIRKAACDAGVLEEARVNAIERLRQLFQFAGYSNVNVNISEGSC